jgi:hypothetical protein
VRRKERVFFLNFFDSAKILFSFLLFFFWRPALLLLLKCKESKFSFVL